MNFKTGTIWGLIIVLLFNSLIFGQIDQADSAAVTRVLNVAGYVNPNLKTVITTDPLTGRITSFIIPGIGMDGDPAIDPAIGSLTELRSLTIQGGFWGSFNSLPATLGNLKKLECLIICANTFSTLPSTITRLVSLKHIDISKNSFISFPNDIVNLFDSLEYLNINGNMVASLPNAISLPDTFYAYSCHISSLPDLYLRAKSPKVASFGKNALCNLTAEKREWLSSVDTSWEASQACMPPAITMLGQNPFFMMLNSDYKEPGVKASDDFDGDLTSSITTKSTLNKAIEGTYEITYTVKDVNNNTTSKTRTIIVLERDTTVPVVTLKGSDSYTIEQFHPYVEPGSSAFDPMYGTVDVIKKGVLDTSSLGTYELTYSATDSAGNTGTAIRTIHIVKDTIPPELTLLGSLSDTISTNGTFFEPGFKAKDGDIDLTADVVRSKFDSTVQGTYTVTYTVKDYSGLSTSKNRTITVISNYIHPDIAVNQIGYYNDFPKIATIYSCGLLDSFYIRNTDNEIVFRGVPKRIKTNYYDANFTELKKSGSYHVWIPAMGKTSTFKIDTHVYKDVFRATLKAYYYQRSSFSIDSNYAGKWKRNAGHPDTSVEFHSTSGKSGNLRAPGGWYDAGDYGKYIVNGGITVATLMSLHELCPALVGDGFLGIPESGNGKSDLLDEIKYELDWFKTMQDDDGGVFFKVTTMKYPGFVMPEADNEQRFVFGKSTASTLNFAAVMAQAGRVFKKYDKDYAEDCITRAQNAWKWASQNSSVVVTREGTGEYYDTDFADEFMWAATELWITTGDDQYKTQAKVGGSYRRFNTWADVDNQNTFSIIFNKNIYENQFKNVIPGFLRNSVYQIIYCDELLYNVYDEFDWGSNANHVNMLITALSTYLWSGDSTYLFYTAKAIDYIFGRNKYDQSFVTGFGSRPPLHPHHRISIADGVDDPVPGFLVGGANRKLQDKATVTYPVGVDYLDNQNSYATNSVAINWNAPLAFLLGYFENLHGGLLTKNEHNITKRVPDKCSVAMVRNGRFHKIVINGIPATVNKLQVTVVGLNGRCIYSRVLDGVKKECSILCNSRIAKQVCILRVSGDGVSLNKRVLFAE